MNTFREIWGAWKKKRVGDGSPLALADALARRGYACAHCARLVGPGGECDCPAALLERTNVRSPEVD